MDPQKLDPHRRQYEAAFNEKRDRIVGLLESIAERMESVEIPRTNSWPHVGSMGAAEAALRQAARMLGIEVDNAELD